MLKPVRRFVSLLSFFTAVAAIAIGTGAAASASASARADFNDDGFADLAVGVPGETWATQSGGINVIYGSPSGVSATATPDQYFDQDSPNIDGVAEASDYFGRSLATGDFNDDGFSDLIVGVPFEDEGASTDSGAINVIYGSPSGLSATVTPDQYIHPDSAGIEGVAETGDEFATTLATGDFNNDGITDAAIGVPGEDTGPTDDGGINVIYGSPNGLSAAPILDQYLGQDSPNVDGIAETDDKFGASLASGDFNHDGFSDLLAGVPTEDEGASTDGGAVNVIFGSASGLAANVTPGQYIHPGKSRDRGRRRERRLLRHVADRRRLQRRRHHRCGDRSPRRRHRPDRRRGDARDLRIADWVVAHRHHPRSVPGPGQLQRRRQRRDATSSARRSPAATSTTTASETQSSGSPARTTALAPSTSSTGRRTGWRPTT